MRVECNVDLAIGLQVVCERLVTDERGARFVEPRVAQRPPHAVAVRLGPRINEEPSVRHAREQPRPELERHVGDLGEVVEATECRRTGEALRQSASQRRRGIAPIAMRQAERGFGVVTRLFRRIEKPVGHAIVDRVGARRAAIREIRDLHRRRLARERQHPVAAGMCGEIHEDVDAVGTYALGELLVGKQSDVAPSVHVIADQARRR